MLHLPSFLAYIDPGSGSLLLQMLIAGAVGGIAFFRNSLLGFFGFWKRKPKNPEDPSKPNQEP